MVSRTMCSMQHKDVQLPCQERPVYARGDLGRTTQRANLHPHMRIFVVDSIP